MAIIVEIPRQKVIEEGDYMAILKDVQELQGKYGPILRFWFEITEPGYETTVSGICSKNARTPKSKLFRWLVALGADLRSETIDISSLIGASAIITVSSVTTPDGEEYLNVVDVKRANIRRVHSVNPEYSTVSGAAPEYYQQVSVSPQPNTQVRQMQQPQPQVQSFQQPQSQPQLRTQNPQTMPKKQNPFIEEINDLDELEF